MKKLIIFVLISAFIPLGFCQDISFTEDEFSDLLTNYYKNPDVYKIIPAIEHYTSSEFYNKVNSRMSLAHFFAYALKEFPDITQQLYENQTKDGNAQTKIFAVCIFWVLDQAHVSKYFQKAENEWKEESVQSAIMKLKEWGKYNVLSDTLTDPSDLDNLWGIFLATGNPEPVKKIISSLFLLNEDKEEHRVVKILIGGAARWSLTSNARQHKKVYKIIKRSLSHYSGENRKVLEDILAKSKKNTSKRK